MRLSKDDLSSLHLLISLKVTDCGGEGLVDLEDEMAVSYEAVNLHRR